MIYYPISVLMDIYEILVYSAKTTDIKPLYITIATVTINLIVTVVIVLSMVQHLAG